MLSCFRWGVAVVTVAGCFETGSSTHIGPSCDRDCRLALGANIYVPGIRTAMDGDHLEKLDEVGFAPEGIVSATRLSDSLFLARAEMEGTTELRGKVDGDDRRQTITVVPATVGPIVVDTLPKNMTVRPATFGVYAGSPKPRVWTYLVDATGEAVFGFGLERWTPEDRLGEPARLFGDGPAAIDWTLVPDHPLHRTVTVHSQPVTISNGVDTVTFAEVPLRSAARFELYNLHPHEVVPETPWRLSTAGSLALEVAPFSADEVFLLGDAGPVQVVADTANVSIEVLDDGRSFVVQGRSPGSAVVTVTYDGVTATYPVVVQ